MKALRFAAALAILLLWAFAANAAEVAIPSAPSAWVTDTAGLLMPQTVATLDARLHAYEDATGHQILVYVAPTTGDTPTEEWTEKAFAHWKVGRKGIDDGLILFVFPTDRKVRIEVGYGLEQTVPDALAARIIRNTIVPDVRDGKPDEAVVVGVDAILATVGGEIAAPVATPAAAASPPDGETDADPVGVVIGVLLSIGIIVVLIVLIGKLPRSRGSYISGGNSGSALWDVLSIGAGILGSGIGGSSGGFSGGGGSGGGGGATGSW